MDEEYNVIVLGTDLRPYKLKSSSVTSGGKFSVRKAIFVAIAITARKSLIKQVKCCLMIQMNRRNAIIRQSRIDIAQLLQNGLQHIMLSRVEQLYKDQCTFSAYTQIDQFCNCICEEIHEISRSSDKLSTDAREALSSLIFAASRCGELPELQLIRNLFKRQFGHHFERVNVELLPGNNVNSQLKYNLTEISSVPDDTKLQLMNEIAKEFTLCLGSSEINDQDLDPNVPKLQMSNLSHKKRELNEKIVGSNFSTQNNSDYPANKDQSRGSIFTDMIRKIGTNFYLSDCTKLMTTHCDSLDCIKSKVSSDYSTKTNNAGTQELVIVNLDGIEEQSLTKEDYSNGNLDSWVENVNSETIYGKKKRNSALMKNDNETNDCKSLANKQGSDLINSCKELETVGQFCDRKVEEDSEPRLNHVHPKLPDYDELVEKFTDLKKDYMQKNSNNRMLKKWLRCHVIEEDVVNKNEDMNLMRRRVDTFRIAGSRLPYCSHACGSCSPCHLVMVHLGCTNSLAQPETCPMAYKCLCGNKPYPVP
ncbi:hypothetical protein LguiA_035529 [Lonicera macranthoides]